MPLTRDAFRAYYCAALQSVPFTMSGGTPLAPEERHKKALALAELAQAEEEVRFRSGEDVVEGLRAEVRGLEAQLATARSMSDVTRHEVLKALGESDMGKGWCSTTPLVRELHELAQLRAEEVSGQRKELLEFGQCTEALVRRLWPGEEAELILESEVCGETTALFARIRERVAMVGGDRRIPVDHAAETLAQLEVTLGTHLEGHPTDDTQAERWGRVAGRVFALVELEHAHERRVSAELAEHLRGVSVQALEAFLKRHTDKAGAEAEPVRGALLGFVQELAALMVRHCAPAGAGLLGGTALVESAALNPGEVPECGAPSPDVPVRLCSRPLGHRGQHESVVGGAGWRTAPGPQDNQTAEEATEWAIDARHGSLAPTNSTDFIHALRGQVARWLDRIDETLDERCRRAVDGTEC